VRRRIPADALENQLEQLAFFLGVEDAICKDGNEPRVEYLGRPHGPGRSIRFEPPEKEIRSALRDMAISDDALRESDELVDLPVDNGFGPICRKGRLSVRITRRRYDRPR
jgi:hypothetical protein